MRAFGHCTRCARRCALALALAAALAACKNRNPTGELIPPSDASAWESKYRTVFDDNFTPTPVRLSGRAPNDVLDQKLFNARLGYADLVALVRVEQVWGRGLYEGRQQQYLEVELQRALVHELPDGASEQQLIPIESEDELPGSLRGREMLLFLRWAPGEAPPYHHHMMFAESEQVALIEAMVRHAEQEGQFGARGDRKARREARKNKRASRRATKDKETKAK